MTVMWLDSLEIGEGLRGGGLSGGLRARGGPGGPLSVRRAVGSLRRAAEPRRPLWHPTTNVVRVAKVGLTDVATPPHPVLVGDGRPGSLRRVPPAEVE